MKRLYILIAVLALLASCQVINTDDRYIEMPKTETTDRVVLLMDFTGWKCVNCPNAAQTANGLLQQYPENLIVVSMHPEGSMFTEPGAIGPDFESQDATEYLEEFGSSTGTATFPTGIVDMTKYKGDYFCEYSTWASAVTKRMEVETQYNISMDVTETDYSIDVECVSGEAYSNLNLIVWLIEDSIVGSQMTEGDVTLTDYVHRHVFRGSLNGLWGEKVGDNPIEGELELPELQGEHFAVVAVLVNAQTHEVLQCAEAVVGGGDKPKNPGDFIISTDEDGNDVINDGDTVRVSHFDNMTGQLGFEGYIHIDNQSDVDFTIVESRDFNDSIYVVTMCTGGMCRSDNPKNRGHWGPFELEADQVQDFQSHIQIPAIYEEDEEGEPVFKGWDQTPMTFTTIYTFSNGNTANDKTITVIFNYTPEPSSQR